MEAERKLFTVSELNSISRQLIENGFPGGVWVVGEVREYKIHSSGNCYFSLRDDNAQIDCTMWRNIAQTLDWKPENGMKVEAFGQPSIYEKAGRYQFLVKKMIPAGQGARAIAFAKLKKKLEQEGLFDQSHKKAIPEFPFVVGVATSQTGAAVRDIINITKRRAPWVTIILRNTKVQGDSAPADIVDAVHEFNRFGEIDVLIIGRGGGSEEDLWCFNDESVARAIYESEIPIISAVGHETDFTIADFVADVRAPTPSAAAELAVPNRVELAEKLADILRRTKNILSNKILNYGARLDHFKHKLEFASPAHKITEYKRTLDELYSTAQRCIDLMMERNRARLQNNAQKLNLLSIDRILSRGFSIVKKDDTIIRSAEDVDIEDMLNIIFHAGGAIAKVQNVKKETKEII